MNEAQITIQNQLLIDCQAFITVVNGLSEVQFNYQTDDNKWSIAEVMQHLYLSARPVARLMTGPREFLLQWGKATAPSKTYDYIATTYQKALEKGGKAPTTMSPRPEDMLVGKDGVIERFSGVYQTLADATGTWSDEELNTYLIPHPLLGKLTVREMLYFTSAHTQHHLRLLPEV